MIIATELTRWGAQKGQLEIWFGRLLLGHLDPQEVDFLRSEEAS